MAWSKDPGPWTIRITNPDGSWTIYDQRRGRPSWWHRMWAWVLLGWVWRNKGEAQ